MIQRPNPIGAAPSHNLAKTADEYIERLGDWRGEIIQELRELVVSTIPKGHESIRWGQIVYELNGPFCYLKAFRNQVHIGFWRGDQIADPKQLLEKSKDKMRHIKFTDFDQIQLQPLRNMLKSAVKLNRDLGDPTVTTRAVQTK